MENKDKNFADEFILVQSKEHKKQDISKNHLKFTILEISEKNELKRKIPKIKEYFDNAGRIKESKSLVSKENFVSSL